MTRFVSAVDTVQPPRAQAVAARRSVPIRPLVLAIVAVQSVVLYLVLSDGYWIYDDWLSLALARENGLTLEYLRFILFDHFGPGYRLVFDLQTAVFPIDYRVALIVMLACLAAGTVLLERILALLFGPRWLHVALAATMSVSVVLVEPLLWWSSGLLTIPTIPLSLLAIYAYLRHQRGDGWRWLALSLGVLAVALTLYVKPLLVIGVILGIRILFLSRDLRPRVLAAMLWRERVTWIAYGVLAVIYLWVATSAGLGEADYPVPSVGQLVEYAGIVWARAFGPAVIGLTTPETESGAGVLATVIAGQVAIAAAVAWSLHRDRAAWRAWTLLAVLLGASSLLIGLNRIPPIGVGVGYTVRYLAEFSWLVPLAIAGAFAPRDPGRRSRRALPLPRPLPAAVGGLALAAYLAAAGGDLIDRADAWAGDRARAWAQRLQASIDRLPDDAVVADANVPAHVVVDPLYSRLSRLLPLFDERVRVDGPVRGGLYALGEDGALRPAQFVPTSDGAAPALAQRGELRVTGGRTLRRPGELCVIADGQAAQVERRLAATMTGAPVYLRIAYRAPRALEAGVIPDEGKGYGAYADHGVELAAGEGESVTWTGVASLRAVRFDIPPRSAACLRRVDVGTVG